MLGLSRRRKTAQALALRARIVLPCADSAATNTAIAKAMGLSLMTVSKWRRRFAQHGVAGLEDAPRSGAPRSILDEQVEAVITARTGERARQRHPLVLPMRWPLSWG